MRALSTPRMATLVLFCLAPLAVLVPRPAPAADGGVDVQVDWSMADRYGLDENEDGIIDPHDTVELVQPAGWRVRVDACASSGGNTSDPIEHFEVQVDGVPAGSFTECEISLDLPAEGTYQVALTAITVSGDRGRAVFPVTVRDWLIVGLGDSYASGEGVPDIYMADDGFERALSAYEALDEARRGAEKLRSELDVAGAAVETAIERVEAAREALDRAADDVRARLSALNRALAKLADVEADARPVRDALAQWKEDCVDDFGILRCPVATGKLVAELVAFGVSAAEELVRDGYDAIVQAIESTVAAAQRGVDAARDLYNRAVGVRDAAKEAWNAAVAVLDEAQETLDTVQSAVSTAEAAEADAREFLQLVTANVREQWQDEDCHRSARSAQAQAALALERMDPRSSVTFVHLACSGATTADVAPEPEPAEPPEGRTQIEELRGLVGTREIDAVILSIGGNDAGFSKIIKSLIRHRSATGLDVDFDAVELAAELCPAIPGLSEACEGLAAELPQESAAEILANALPGLPAGYARVAAALSDLVEPGRVFITEYPDGTRSDGGEYCGPTAAPGITSEEWRWLDEVATAGINAAVAAAASEHGWTRIDTLHELFDGHGYCADAHWMVRLEESVVTQGDIAGTAHPNASGHAALGEEMARLISAELDPGGSFTSFHRSDCNADGTVDIADPVSSLGFQFVGTFDPPCRDALDFDDNGVIDVSDPVANLTRQFVGGPPPAPPGEEGCGVDRTGDELSCDSFPACDEVHGLVPN